MLNKLTEHDLFVVVQSMSFILDSGRYYPDEIGAKFGVDQQTLCNIRNWLQHLLDDDVDESEIVNRSGIPKDDFCLAIHNSLVDVAYGEAYDDDEIKPRFGIVRQDVDATFERWEALGLTFE